MKPGYTIGLTMHVKPDGDLGLFENGLKQNVHFLHQLFASSPNCKRAFLLNHGEAKPIIKAGYPIKAKDVVYTADVIDQLDYVIGVGTAIDKHIVDQLHSRGAKVIGYKGGNGAVMNMEAVGSHGYHGGLPGVGSEAYFDCQSFDQIWVTPQHMHTCQSWYETIYQCPVHEVPQVWSPALIEATKTPGWGYKPGKRPWRVGVLDPNNTVMKTSHWPMLICERAWREDPSRWAAFLISNSVQFKENEAFKSFALALSSATTPNAAKTGSVMSFEPRFVTSQFLATYCDAVVTHQWENDLNYLYYDVLYGGYPLIHNSPALREYGYFYESFDASDGRHALMLAYEQHDLLRSEYQTKNAQLFKALSPKNRALQEAHERLID
ncbi:MAG: DUF2827 family protein [Terriglobales bacterium]